MKRSGISSRWLRGFFSLMAVLVILTALVAGIAITRYYYSCMRSGMEAKLQTISDFFEDYAGTTEELFYSNVFSLTGGFEDRNVLELEFIGPDGEIISSSSGLSAGESPETEDVSGAFLRLDSTVFEGRDPSTGEHIMAVTVPLVSGEKVVGAFRLVSSLRLADRRALTSTALIFGLALLCLLLIAVTGSYFIRSIVTPVVEITETAKRIAAGGYGAQLQTSYTDNEDEIGELTRTMNDLSLQISQTERLQTEFLSSVSHELRTPLTAIAGWGETLLAGDELDPEDVRRGIGTMLKETKRLQSLVEELLEFSRLQDGRIKLNIRPCDLRTVFEDTIFMYGKRLSQDGIQLLYDYEDETEIPEIPCDEERIKQVFLNILDNAAKYGGAGGSIDCQLTADAESVLVSIRDFGPGIPQDELPLVKKKFYRGSASVRGNGIGLAVCEEIVSMHGGSLVIANAADERGGCLVTIRLPVK